jgi:hypothetical protein
MRSRTAMTVIGRGWRWNQDAIKKVIRMRSRRWSRRDQEGFQDNARMRSSWIQDAVKTVDPDVAGSEEDLGSLNPTLCSSDFGSIAYLPKEWSPQKIEQWCKPFDVGQFSRASCEVEDGTACTNGIHYNNIFITKKFKQCRYQPQGSTRYPIGSARATWDFDVSNLHFLFLAMIPQKHLLW